MNSSLRTPPDLAYLVSLIRRGALLQTNCHAIGTIESFDPETRTASAKIAYTRIVNGKSREYPPLINVPVLIYGGGGGQLTFKISKGDVCEIHFNDVNMDIFIENGTFGAAPDDTRSHSFSDAIIFVGLDSIPGALAKSYFPDGAELSNDDTKIQLTDKVKIMNDVTDLKTVINGLLDLLSASLCASPGSPLSNAAAFTAYKTIVGGLLK